MVKRVGSSFCYLPKLVDVYKSAFLVEILLESSRDSVASLRKRGSEISNYTNQWRMEDKPSQTEGFSPVSPILGGSHTRGLTQGDNAQ